MQRKTIFSAKAEEKALHSSKEGKGAKKVGGAKKSASKKVGGKKK